MRAAGLVTIAMGVLLVLGHGHLAGVVSLIRHALRIFT
jgi:hypothetical protein